jgi:NTP pyrophosphatase (non-canonical NTP hydrolase)
MNRLNEALVILMEEASEVAKAASKCIRFSEDKDYVRLEEEIGDFLCVYQWLIDEEIVDPEKVELQIPKKKEKLKKYSRLYTDIAYKMKAK